MHDYVSLSGLDASNPLAFLAALGTLRFAAAKWPQEQPRLSWSFGQGKWTPCLYLNSGYHAAALIPALFGALEQDAFKHPIAFLQPVQVAEPMRSRGMFEQTAAQSDAKNRDAADFLVALCSDIAPQATCQLQTVRRDYFWGNLVNIMRRTTADHLRRSLLELWDYADPLDGQSLHLEPGEDRRHGLQWHEPTSDPTRKQFGGMIGANRMALEAFPFFPSMPRRDKLATRGFRGARAGEIFWTWPVWTSPLDVDVVASSLDLATLQADAPDLPRLAAMGIPAVFRCARILVGKTPNLTPAMQV